MGSVAMYLDGPGQKRRSVKILATEQIRVSAQSVHSRRDHQPSASEIEVRTLVDEQGNIAKQIDYDGYRFKYRDSEILWNLVLG